MKIVLAILFFLVVLLVALFMLYSFINSADTKKEVKQRQCDLLVGVVLFAVLVVAVKVFGGMLL